MNKANQLKVFAGSNSKPLGEEICAKLGVPLGDLDVQRFADGEFAVTFNENIRGRDVFLIQSTYPSSDNLFELLMMMDAAKRASAKSINAVVPYFGWARQDRKDKPRVSIAAKLVADMMGVAGIERLVTMDLHADQIQGFFNVPVDHLYASTILVEYVKSLDLKDLVFASPDAGGVKRANSYAKYFGVPLVICHKYREKANEVAEMRVIGDIKGKNVILVDDMVDTAGTITKAGDLMMKEGATSVRAMASHAVLSDPAYERIEESDITEMIFTDSIPLRKVSPKIKIVSIAEMLSTAVNNVFENESISSMFVFNPSNV
jgi:ribose-phosphate pyrophosphokinase